MKISINWIKDFVNLDGIEPEELIKRFNLSTAEIEGVEVKGADVQNVVFGKVLKVENHPESNHLHILKVDVGSGRWPAAPWPSPWARALTADLFQTQSLSWTEVLGKP